MLRCEVCDWPLAASAAEGCVPGNCSYRPREGSDEWRRIKKRCASPALQAAIRRFTVDMPDDEPNGKAELFLRDLATSLEIGDVRNARRFFGSLCDALADDVKELRQAAEAYFGGDFRSPPQQLSIENGMGARGVRPESERQEGGSERDRASTSGGVSEDGAPLPSTAQRKAVAAGQPGEPPPQGPDDACLCCGVFPRTNGWLCGHCINELRARGTHVVPRRG